jgi:RimJ/RimL family protein N-acetyltransferase
VRRATAEDREALRRFRCGLSPWYVREAQEIVRGIPSHLTDPGLEALLFESLGTLAAVSAFQPASNASGELIILALETSYQGRRLAIPDGRPLAVAALEETLAQMGDAGYTRAVAWVAKEHEKSQRLLQSSGFTFDATLDPTYDFAAAVLPSD